MENSIAQMIQVGKLIKGMKPNQIKINTLKSSVLTLYLITYLLKSQICIPEDPYPVKRIRIRDDPLMRIRIQLQVQDPDGSLNSFAITVI